MSITEPDRIITDSDGVMTQRFQIWAAQVTQLDIIIGTGTPETFVAANQGRLYMDETGASGSVLYIKRDADILGDKTQGWIAV